VHRHGRRRHGSHGGGLRGHEPPQDRRPAGWDSMVPRRGRPRRRVRLRRRSVRLHAEDVARGNQGRAARRWLQRLQRRRRSLLATTRRVPRASTPLLPRGAADSARRARDARPRGRTVRRRARGR
jgi:hypothetical protein